MEDRVFFVKNIPKYHDYNFIYSYFSGFGQLKYFKPVYDSKMTFIRFVFLEYNDKRSIYQMNEAIKNEIDNHIIDYTKINAANITINEEIENKCKKLRRKLIAYKTMDKKQKDDRLYIKDKEAWKQRTKDIADILHDF